ncbi:Male sterility, NAD-binding protein [Ophiocordyceps sinensis CO18]|uniref:Male sterility, NAD-binding protein n=1 Tax=Ophiocordyceps sinensis (strain Co18 / CGMCC 3.14243) TaxID=911162 RepID=T5A330_OPHSC|nr:Male sterility, NAD-binding protein [Ophiocordyceps sinensis CO18]
MAWVGVKREPSRPFVMVPNGAEANDGWSKVTYKQVTNAINHVAADITGKLGPAVRGTFPTVGYIGPNDVRYLVMMLGCVKAGYKAFFVSPRNSLEGFVSLFEATDCNAFYYAEASRQLVQTWTKKRPMLVFEAPSAHALLNAEPQPFPYSRSFEEAQWEPMVVLHTSGSTGIPKPIVVKQGSFALADAFRFLPMSHGAKFSMQEWSDRSKRLFLPMPMFHAAAVYVSLTMAVFYGQAIALGIPERPLNSELVIQCLAKSGADAALLPPSILEELSHSEEGIEMLRRLNFVSFGGGALSKQAGDTLVGRGVTLDSSIASTEHYPYPRYFQNNSKLWQYFPFNMDAMGAEWRPLEGDDGLRELVFVRNDSDQGRRQQGVFYTFPDAREWATKDIFRRHPDLPNHWMYQGRIDNIIVFSTGEKLNPVSIEDAVTSHAKVKGAVVVGQQRFQPLLLIEPASHPTSEEEKERFIDELWPLVEEINKETVAHGRINRSFVGLTDAAKPLPRAGKGSIQRAAALKLYEEEIDNLYDNAWAGGAAGSVALDFDSVDTLTASIVDLLQTKFGAPELEGDTDMFSVGIDSAQVIQMANMLRLGVDAAHPSENPESVAPKDVYANPTPSQLAGRLLAVVNGSSTEGQEPESEVAIAQRLLAKYTADMPARVSGQQEPVFEGQTVLLTGTTGSLGAYMLDMMCSSPQVKKIVALNRGKDGGRSRQPGVSGERGLGQDFSKVEFVAADLSKTNLGLEEKMYKKLLNEADRIIHNAWPVNFNISVGSFEPHIRGVRHFVDFAAAAKKRVPVLFLSSVSTAGAWNSSEEVPEVGFTDLNLPTMGYGRSKAVSSLILDEARERSGLSTAVIRVGQIGGPRGKKGAWNKQEFYPSLVASATHLGVLPDQLGPRHVVDWVPIEDAAPIILEIAGVTAEVPASTISGYYHASNPAKTDWAEVAHAVKRYYGDRIKRLVSLEEWLEVLEKSATENADLEKNPSIKLLDTHRQNVAAYKAGKQSTPFDTKRARENSAVMRKMDKINPGLVALWCRQWGF